MAPIHQTASPPTPFDLVAAPDILFDSAALRAEIEAAAQDAKDLTALRTAAVKILGAANTAARAMIADYVTAHPFHAAPVVRSYAWLTDQIVLLTMELAERWLHPNPNPTAGERISLLAVGGYGRGEMAPFSDVDLLFLTPYKQTAWGESIIESVLYTLWDLRLKVGHATRTVEDCLRLAREDITIRTALLEQRFLLGDEGLARDLDKRLWNEIFLKTGPEFVEAKLEERAARHRRTGGSRYLVEPNVKEGKGGLRDLQTLFWIAKYINQVKEPTDLIDSGVFTEDEFRIFAEAEEFLWAVRCNLHLMSRRANEQLTFDAQVEVAAAMGFEDADGQRGVERFMQLYYTHARHVGELTRIFLAALEARHVKQRPNLTRSIARAIGFGRNQMPKGYEELHGRLNVADPDAFLADPVNILRLFEVALRTGILIHPDTMRLVAANLDLIDDTVRDDPEANRIFLGLLLDHGNPERALLRMNELNVLGTFLPEFGRIVAMMQFNMYHHYTVDEHTIRCISTLSEIEHGDLVEELPVASDILSKGVNRRILYVALLLHDIGKGLPQDHSVVGAEIATRLAPRLGLDEHEVDTVVWLVRNHLLMSDVAQKRDLSDPRTVRDFARIVQSPARLKLLTVLTVCDIRGVGPGVWNNWKAMLLRDLYAQTMDMLTDGHESQTRKELEVEAKADLRAKLDGDWSDPEIEAEIERHYAPYWLGLDGGTHLVFARLQKELADSGFASAIEPDLDRDATRICFMMQDHPGLFARLAGALALVGANVVDARTYTTNDGLATAVFWIQDGEGHPYEAQRLDRLRRMIDRSLLGEVVPRDELRSRDKVKKRERDFEVPTAITFDNQGSDIFTIIEVDTRDRPGLLHDLARTMTDCNISISSAIIATYGEQAVDAFYVKDLFGLKIHSEAKQKMIEERLRSAIARGVEMMIS
ncbi:[protein-PII] uridylyltransferase [Oceanomicrobium pacificus]|uniref:Bifunctional uridylyltransferase/uridylyl-removing enzyme n=1 Tax=Oceanomicrobium pacificus TaxID=2692916 RepID=A0A6B0TRW9_9RHOB|nr:[protein-PII] uridylyltransferase [Oceanomicrobium pacificus]MXU64478.1 [protein-PII] uridylyltransferase [Oceanomicrobium pacificus]